MDTEGMKPHPIFESLSLVTDEIHNAVYKGRSVPSGPSTADERYETEMISLGKALHRSPVVGWDRAFEDMEEDDAREQAFAFSLGFADAAEYHAETNWCDQVGVMPDWQDEGDDVDEAQGYSRSDLLFGDNWS